MRLQRRIAVLFLFLLLIPIPATGILALDYTIDTMVRNLSHSADLLTEQIFEQMELVVGSRAGDPTAQLRTDAALRKLLESSEAFGASIVSATVVAPDGTIILAAHGEDENKPFPALKPVAALKKLTSGWFPGAAITGLGNTDVYELRRPVFAKGRQLAAISVAVTTALMVDRVRRLRLMILAATAVDAILVCIMFSVADGRILTRSSHYGHRLKALAVADSAVDLGSEGDRKLEVLSERFNELSRRVSNARSALVSRGDHLFDIVRSIQDAVLLLDPSKSILFVNQQALDQLALVPDKSEGNSLSSALGPDHPLVRLVDSAMDAGIEAHDVPIELGRGKSLLVSLCKLGHGRTPAGLLAILRDMKSVLELQTALDYSNGLARLGALISGLAHQLRSPLQAISLRLELLKAAGPDSKDRHIDRIRLEMERLDRSIEALLRLTRPEHLEITEFDLNQLTREAAARIRNERIQVVDQLTRGMLSIHGDRAMIGEAINNVITNAVQAMPTGGVLTLGSRRLESEAELTVKDTGVGIEKERLEHIFDLYYTTKPNGNGLGLALAFRAIELNKGTIRIDSSVGEVTICTINLPNADDGAAEVATDSTESPG